MRSCRKGVNQKSGIKHRRRVRIARPPSIDSYRQDDLDEATFYDAFGADCNPLRDEEGKWGVQYWNAFYDLLECDKLQEDASLLGEDTAKCLKKCGGSGGPACFAIEEGQSKHENEEERDDDHTSVEPEDDADRAISKYHDAEIEKEQEQEGFLRWMISPSEPDTISAFADSGNISRKDAISILQEVNVVLGSTDFEERKAPMSIDSSVVSKIQALPEKDVVLYIRLDEDVPRDSCTAYQVDMERYKQGKTTRIFRYFRLCSRDPSENRQEAIVGTFASACLHPYMIIPGMSPTIAPFRPTKLLLDRREDAQDPKIFFYLNSMGLKEVDEVDPALRELHEASDLDFFLDMDDHLLGGDFVGPQLGEFDMNGVIPGIPCLLPDNPYASIVALTKKYFGPLSRYSG
jgi:hypothetical protein